MTAPLFKFARLAIRQCSLKLRLEDPLLTRLVARSVRISRAIVTPDDTDDSGPEDAETSPTLKKAKKKSTPAGAAADGATKPPRRP